MAATLHDAATQKAEQLAARLKGLLSSGVGYLNSEFGIDLGLQPDLYPPWVILFTACMGLLVIIMVSWALVCRRVSRAKPKGSEKNEIVETEKPTVKNEKSEEPKKKSKKKSSEKKSQANGRPVVEPQQDVQVPQAATPQPVVDNKTEKVKNKKKKAKPAVVPLPQATVSPPAKEPEPEGNWETKVSQKEKRQQKRKEKGTGDGSPCPAAGTEAPAQPSPIIEPSKPTTQRKVKGEAPRAKPAKAEPVVSKAAAQWEDTPAVNGGEWSNTGLSLPAQKKVAKAETWSSVPKTSVQATPELSVWDQEVEGWTVVNKGIPSAFPVIDLTASGVESRPVTEMQWGGEPLVDDEWSGLNGMTNDPSSDWNAPSEVWGNYEEPQPVVPTLPSTQAATSNPPTRVSADDAQGSEDEKDKGDPSSTSEGSKGKKKKKKKKKAEESGIASPQEEAKESPAVEATPPPPVQATSKAIATKAMKSPKPTKPSPSPAEAEQPRATAAAQEKNVQKSSPQGSSQQQAPADAKATSKQPSPPPPAQDKPETKSESPKQAKKKKARRET